VRKSGLRAALYEGLQLKICLLSRHTLGSSVKSGARKQVKPFAPLYMLPLDHFCWQTRTQQQAWLPVEAGGGGLMAMHVLSALVASSRPPIHYAQRCFPDEQPSCC
jgi:hypothetical protein